MSHQRWTSLLLVALAWGCGRGVLTNPVPGTEGAGGGQAGQAGHDQSGPVEAGPEVARDAGADGEDRPSDVAPPPPDVVSDVPPDVRPDVAPDVVPDVPPDAVTPEFTGELTRISVSPAGAEGNGWSGGRVLGGGPMVSGDGRLVVFESEASNLVDGDTNGVSDIFVHDRSTKQTRRLTVAPGGGNPDGPSETPSISVDGAHIAFRTAARNLGIGGLGTGRFQIVTWSAESRTFAGHSPRASADCFNPVVSSANGPVVAFETTSPLVAATDTGGISNVYVANLGMPATERASVGWGDPPAETNMGSFGPAITTDGYLVAFESDATNLVPGDTNGHRDVFLRNRVMRGNIRVSTGLGGVPANGYSMAPSISANGRRIAYGSSASNLVVDDFNMKADIFVSDLTGKPVRASLASDGTEANDFSYRASLSGDGRLVAFASMATNLVPGDVRFPGERDTPDVFVHDMVTRKTFRISVPLTEEYREGAIRHVEISASGRVVMFITDLPNLVPGDDKRVSDVFVYEFKTAPWL